MKVLILKQTKYTTKIYSHDHVYNKILDRSFISSFFSNDKIESAIYICDFHREQAWERWLSKSSNGLLNEKQKVLAKLRAIAKARTEEEYRHRLSDLQDSEEWRTNTNLSNYITKTWLPQHKVYAYLPSYFLEFLAGKANF